jgi:hypothetical protein
VPPSLPIKQADWPTLGEMIDSGKRGVVFLDANADGTDSINFIMPEFQMVHASIVLSESCLCQQTERVLTGIITL